MLALERGFDSLEEIWIQVHDFGALLVDLKCRSKLAVLIALRLEPYVVLDKVIADGVIGLVEQVILCLD